MFLDEKELRIEAGKGGDGAILFRREIYVPRGGPDGGDGGRGGDIYIESKGNLHALSHLARIDRIEAEDGAKGGHKKATGKSGQDQILEVPLGTEVYEQIDGGWQKLTELIQEGERIRLVKGGNGGWGNWHFRTSVKHAPERANPGQPGESKQIKLVLKLIADIGLVGLPNAGKSTLLAAISAARPKIADYPFTTLEPQLGVAQIMTKEGPRQWVIADLPGLIEGASQGKGLGVAFLKHIERTKTIIHCLDSSQSTEEIERNYRTVRQELEKWSTALAHKPELVALTKIDLLPSEEITKKQRRVAAITVGQVFPISAVSKQGIEKLLTACVV